MTKLLKPSSVRPKKAPTDEEIPGYSQGRPMVIPPGGGQPRQYARVTNFIGCIEAKDGLHKWEMNHVLRGLAKMPWMLDEIRAIDPDHPKAFMQYQEIASKALDASGAHEKRERGTRLHYLSELADQGLPLPADISEADYADLGEYMLLTSSMTMIGVERKVVNDELRTIGTLDRLAAFSGIGPDGKPIQGKFIADMKSGRLDKGDRGMAAQVALYSRSTFYDPKTGERTPLPEDVSRDWGIIIHLPMDKPASLFWADLNRGWDDVLLAAEIRKARRKKKVLHPFVSDVTAPELASSGVSV